MGRSDMPIQMAGVFRYLITLLLLVNGLPTGAAPDPVVMLSRGDCQRATADAGNEMTALHRAMCAEQAARRAGGPPDERTLLNIDRLLRQAVAAGYPAATRYRAGFLARYDLPGDSDGPSRC